jgi:subtilase family serine protease
VTIRPRRRIRTQLGRRHQRQRATLAGLVALADQYAGRHLGFVHAGLYRIGHSRLYHQALHDITAGNNTVRFPPKTISGYHATPGWDPVTGWGTPNASVLIPLLARSVHPGDAKAPSCSS